MNSPLRHIPPVNQLLEEPPLKSLSASAGRAVVVEGVRTYLNSLRQRMLDEGDGAATPPDVLAAEIAAVIAAAETPPLRRVINATGVLLHTGLGRAPLAPAAVEAMHEVARYCSVELDLQSGQRSQRMVAVERLICQLTGAEAALVVNNNAAATLLALTAIGHGREIVVSRGELIEIGGSYRLPDVMTASGARLREIGTTNKTRLSDYEQAIGEETAALLRVHPSNYVVVGFTAKPELGDLVELAHEHELPLIDDIGSGALVDFAKYGLHDEPLAGRSIEAGADVVLFSGDKLLGGPQCGILAGKREMIRRLTKHPLTRALRVDKITLAALAATLRLYRDSERLESELPLLKLLSAPVETLRDRAARLAKQIAALPGITSAGPVDDVTFIGGGSIPTQEIPTVCVAIEPADTSIDEMARRLRSGTPAIVPRTQQNRLLLDLRSVAEEEDVELVQAISQNASP